MASQERVHCLPRAVDVGGSPAWMLTPNYAVNSNSRHVDPDSNHSSCSSKAAARRRLSVRRCSSAARWASSVEVACDVNMRVSGAATSPLLSALSSSRPEKPNNNSGAAMGISLTSSVGAESQAEAQVHNESPDHVCTAVGQAKPRGRALTVELCAACSPVPTTSPNGMSSAARSVAELDATRESNAAQMPRCPGDVIFSRTHHVAGAEATSDSASPGAATPSSTASTSPARKPWAFAGAASAAEEDAFRAKQRTAPPHSFCPVVGAPDVRRTAVISNGDAPALSTGPTTAGYTGTADGMSKAPYTSEESNCEDSAPSSDEYKFNVATSCAWSEEPCLAAASPHAGTARLDDDHVTKGTARKRLCLPEEATETAGSATVAHGPPVAHRVGSDAASPAAVTAVQPAATSVVGAETESEDRVDRAEQRPAQVHDRQIGAKSDADGRSGNGQRSGEDASAEGSAPTPRKDVTSTASQPEHAETGCKSVQLNGSGDGSTAHSRVHQSIGESTGCTPSNGTSAEPAASTDTKKCDTAPVYERAGRLSDKLRAKFKREFNRSWVDINSAPSWPPIKKTKYLTSDWKTVDLRVGVPQRQEKKKNRLFLNSLCYLFDGVYTQKSTLGRKAGMGLFCERPEGFRKGQIITEFVGWLVDREQAESYRKQRAASHIVAVQKGFLYIDGAKEPTYGMGGGSFANDGSEFLGGPGNNAHFYHWFDDELGRTRVFIRATADIRSGQEIFVPYERTYWVDNFEEQAENCPEPFRTKKLEQLRRKIRHAEELNRSRLAANREKAAATRAATASQEAHTSTKHKAIQQQKERRHLQTKNNKVGRGSLKRPLSGYMLFSKNRWRELLLERHQAAEEEPRQQVSSAAPGRDTGASVAAPQKEDGSPQLQPVKTQRRGRRGMKEEPPPSSTLQTEHHGTCAGGEGFLRNSDLEQEGGRRLRSWKGTDSWVRGDAARGVDTREPQGAAGTEAQQPERARIREAGTNTDESVHSHDGAADCVAGGTTTAGAAGALAHPLGAALGDVGVRPRRRSWWLSRSAAPSAPPCVPGDAAAGERLSARAEAELGGASAGAAPAAIKRRTRGERATGKTTRTLTEGLSMAKAREDGRESSETLEGRTSSRRWFQSNKGPQLTPATSRMPPEKGASGRSHVQNETDEDAVGRHRAVGTRAGKAREADVDGHQRNRNTRSVGAARSECATSNRQGTLAVSTGEGVSERCFGSTAAPSWRKRKLRITEGESASRDAGAAAEEGQKEEGCAEVPSVACQPLTRTSAPAGSKAEARLEQKRRNHKEIKRTGDEPGAAKPVGGAREARDAYAVTGSRKSAVLQHFVSIIRKVAAEWKAMSAHERRRWERLAAKQRARYKVLRQKYNPKKPRRSAKQCSRYTLEKPLAYKSKKVLRPQKRKGTKQPRTVETPRDPAKDTQRHVPRRRTVAWKSAAAATAATAVGSSGAPEEAAAATARKTAERRSTRASAPTQMEQLTSEVNAHFLEGKNDDAVERGAFKEAEGRAVWGKRCATRAAAWAAGGVTVGCSGTMSQNDSLRKEEAQVAQVQVEHCVQPQQHACDIQNTEEGEQCDCRTMQRQQPKRSRRHVDTADAATTSKKAADSFIQQKQQSSVSSWYSASCVSSRSTTRSSSSSRNSSRASRSHANTDTRNWKEPIERQDLPLSTNERADAFTQINGLCGVPEEQQHAVDAERQGPRYSPPHQRELWNSQLEEKLQGPPATRQPQQHGGRCQQRKAGERQQSGPREECVPVCSGEQCTRGKRRRSWSPTCAAPADRDSLAA